MSEPKLVVIMGVGHGLGSALAKRFAAGGHPVALGARSTTQSAKIAEDINAAGGRAQAFVADALDPNAVTRLFDDAEVAFGPVGLTIFNIGGRSLKAFLEVDAAEMEETWRTGFFAAFLTAQEAARRMLPRGEGSIFFTGAPSSRIGMAKHAAYAAAKFGVRGMARAWHGNSFPWAFTSRISLWMAESAMRPG